MRNLLLVLILAGCGGSKAAAPAAEAPEPLPPAPTGDPHRKLTADECGNFYDFMKKKGWLAEASAPRDKVIASCLETGATAAFQECIFGSQSREDADRCQ